ncbi:hypothetical protein SCAR479_06998 [Seiridium cardinale]|uniref:Uncharacterized protein n=1 Tax=Seiridium cardinale TaxID=138064 RepID=A0ABR2XRE4_9PEZI
MSSFPRGNITRQNWQGRGRLTDSQKARPPIPNFNPTKDSEADKKPAEPKPKPGTREFARWKLDLHKKNMVEAIEEKELATQKLASNRAKAGV